jgi:NAD(P)-dependent dehydrogenase (short-subunit alcohol dehydrogenase family)
METALITGGGSGIGRELVRLFIQDNFSVIVFSLVQQELDDLADGQTKVPCESKIPVEADG